MAIIIADMDGLIIHNQPNLNLESKSEIDHETVASIIALAEPIIKRMRTEFAQKKFGTAAFDVESFRFINIFAESYLIIFIISNLASVDAIYPYSYLAVEKIYRILEDSDSVDPTIPQLSGVVGKIENIPSNAKFHFKYILGGAEAVGKTSLVYKFVEHVFAHDYRSTIGLNTLTHTYHFLGFEIQLTIFDLGGQSFFKRVRQKYYEGTHAIFIIFDLTRRSTFDEIKLWKIEMDRKVPNIPCCIIGNKSDLTDQRQVQFEEAMLLAEQLGASYMETSALTGANVEDAFALIAYKVLKVYEDQKKL
jgi:small GTP-binding protein